MAVAPSGHMPSLALRVQTFQLYGAFSRYTPRNERSASVPAIPANDLLTQDLGMDFFCVDPQCGCQIQLKEQDNNIIKKSQSTSAMDTILPLPLFGRNGIVTLGYQTLSMDDLLPAEDHGDGIIESEIISPNNQNRPDIPDDHTADMEIDGPNDI